MRNQTNRSGNMLVLLAVGLAALGIGLILAYMQYQRTFDGVEENFLIYQSRDVVQRRAAEAEAANQPQAIAEVVGGIEFDFGVAEPGNLLKHTFPIKNVGQGNLELKLEGVTCKCLTMGLDKDEVIVVKPGETFDVKLEWRSDSSTKNFQQFARIKTNDKEQTQIKLKVTGRIVSPVAVSPDRVKCHVKEAAEGATFEFNVFAFPSDSIDADKFDLKSVVFNKPLLDNHLSFEWEKLTSDDLASEKGSIAGYKVTGTVAPGAPIGTYIGEIQAETTSEHLMALDLAVRVEAPVEVRHLKSTYGINYVPGSQTIDFGLVEEGKSAEYKMLLLYNIDDPDLEITLDDPALEPGGYVTAEVESQRKTGRGKIVQLKVTVPADCPRAQFTGPDEDNMLKLVVHSNSKLAPEMIFFVTFSKK